jgi:uncharacterized protein DUF4349
MSALANTLRSAEKAMVPVLLAGGVVLFLAVALSPNLLRSRIAADQARHAASFEQMYDNTRPQNSRPPQAMSVSLQREAPAAAPVPAPAVSAAKDSSATADRKIERTCGLELTVKSPAEAAEQIRVIAEGLGGYIETAQIGGSKEVPTADLTIRVPAARFEETKVGIRKLATRIEREKTDAQDVTRQYVDREARLRNLRAEETQYLTILKSAYKVDDLLEVTQKLSEVRGEIERQQAEFQTLSKQVETVAITIALRPLADAQVFGLNWRPLYRLKLAARDGVDALADYAATMAGILFYLPVVLAWALTILFAAVLGWRMFRWVARRFFAQASTAPAQNAANPI